MKSVNLLTDEANFEKKMRRQFTLLHNNTYQINMKRFYLYHQNTVSIKILTSLILQIWDYTQKKDKIMLL